MTTRNDCLALDAQDTLAPLRDQFALPEGVIYLDGNSLGARPKASLERAQAVIAEEWGNGLIRSWNSAGWRDLPQRLGDRLASLIGAGDDEVVVTDTTSINLFKVLGAALRVQAERARLQALADWGLRDVVREQHPEPGIYSWWDYRNGSFHRGWGMRIDLALVTKSVADNTTWSAIDRNARKGEQPSDHAPVLIEVSA